MESSSTFYKILVALHKSERLIKMSADVTTTTLLHDHAPPPTAADITVLKTRLII